MKNTFLLFIALIAVACVPDKYDEHLRTFEEDTAASLLENNPELYSEFYSLLVETNVADLLNAYGEYTVFAPTNEGMRRYYSQRGVSLADMTDAEKVELAFNHVLKAKLRSVDFPPGATASAPQHWANVSLISATWQAKRGKTC